MKGWIRTLLATAAILGLGFAAEAATPGLVMGDADYIARGWDALQNAGVFGSMFLLWAYVTERKRSDSSKISLQARIIELEKARDSLLRETLQALYKMTAVVAEAGTVSEKTAEAVEGMTEWLKENIARYGPRTR